MTLEKHMVHIPSWDYSLKVGDGINGPIYAILGLQYTPHILKQGSDGPLIWALFWQGSGIEGDILEASDFYTNCLVCESAWKAPA